MISTNFFPTAATARTFAFTDTVTALTIPPDLQSDIAYPYYMGYINAEDNPIFCTPKLFYEDDTQQGLYHLRDAFPEQNLSWLYMGLYSTNGSGTGQIIYRDIVTDTWKYKNSYYPYRFINGGIMANTNLYNPIPFIVVHLTHDIANDSYTVSLINSNYNLHYADLYNLVYGTATITVDNITVSQSDYDTARNCYAIDDGTTEHIIAFLGMNSNFQTYHGGTPYIQYAPFIKYDNPTTGEIAYIKADTTTIDHRVWIKYENGRYTAEFKNKTVSSSTYGNMQTVYDYILPYTNTDIDCSELYDKRGYYYKNSVIYEYYGYINSGGIWYAWNVRPFINPVEFIKIFNLYNKLTYTSSLQNSQSYTTGIAVSYFSDSNVPLFTGKKETDTYTYSEIVQQLRVWQMVDVDITTNTYDDSTKPTPTPPTPAGEDTTEKHNDENSMPMVTGLRTVSGDAFSTFYELSLYHVAALGNLLSQMPSTFWEALGTATDPKQSNLIDYLISLKWYPLNIDDSTDTPTTTIQFGFNGVSKIDLSQTPGTSYKLSSVNRIYNMGSVTVPYRHTQQTFLDLEPYTSVSAYLPYIGTVALQANDVVGYTINCYYIVDLTTGMCTGILDNGVDTIYIGTGKIGVDISVSGNDILTQSEKMASSYLGAATGAVNNVLSLGSAAASENVVGAAGAAAAGIADLATSAISIANSKRGIPETVGAASGFGGGYTHQTPYIKVLRPAVSIPASYGHDVGYVCNKDSTIGALSGYTVCQNPDLSGIPATAAELDMIRSILCSGFYA